MNDIILKEIIELAFLKAEKTIVQPTKQAICIKISEAFDEDPTINSVTYKTIERAYEKYVLGKKRGVPKQETIDYLCIYLGYENFSDFIKKRKTSLNKGVEPATNRASLLKKVLISALIIISISASLFLATYRKVTIITNQNKDIILYSVKNNNNKKLGILTKENHHTLVIWLMIGESDLYFHDIEDFNQEYPGAERIHVKPFWRSMPKITLSKI
ncbi:hypothetical protein PW52_01480 [Tamlana sedimentorum]|uniref:Uncharacterized protein n=1 Tax=Neotamlana sedimentorum TaxID=1435349 RepID=A0A0D7WDI4_9FLAO|nr:hypothetical protein [Tamlana sedimentorum]KJD37154.1 hypothetical protein PW52_01480 [Tamlana sedimentorum]